MNISSFVKIAFSLFIISAYIFVFGFVGTVEGTSGTMPAQSEQTSFSEETTTALPETTLDFQTTSAYSSLNISNPAKPRLADYNLPGRTEAETEYSVATQPIIIDDSGYTTPNTDTEIIITKDTDPPGTTISPTEQTTTSAGEVTDKTDTTSADTTEAPPQTGTDITDEETEGTTPAETSQDDAEDEILTVYYSGSNGNVSGKAADILARVVMGEIGGSFDEEAIKAQAVAAYTYIKLYNDSGSVPYVAVREPNDRVKKCVGQVLGQAIYYNGRLIQAVYTASTAGYSASALNVWGYGYPYLTSNYCELDEKYDPNYGVKKTFSADQIKSFVSDNTGIELSGDPSQWFKIVSYVDNVYVGTLSIGGKTSYTNSSGKTVNITGRVLREKILEFNLKSACFKVSYSAQSDEFTFTTYGYGHGVGLSQWGAQNLALYKDYNYKQILDFYFPGTQVY